jgi:DNA-binding MarR family transcriptional regulator
METVEKQFENFTITILKINKLVHKIKMLVVRKFGLKAIHVMCMYYLNEHPEGITEAELVKLTLEDKAAISRAVAALDEKGYILFNKGYTTTITLTESGKVLADYINEQADFAVDAAKMSITEEERAQFYDGLRSIADKLQDHFDNLIVKNNMDIPDEDN